MAAYLYHLQVYKLLDKYLGFGDKNKFIMSNILIKFSIVFLVATLATVFIEEPARNLLKKSKKPAVIDKELPAGRMQGASV